MKRKKDLLSLEDYSSKDVVQLIKKAYKLKKSPFRVRYLKGKTLAMIFAKPSNRTRVSFEVGMFQLGGHAINLSDKEVGIGKRESVADVARTLSRFCDGIMIRTFKQKDVDDLAKYASVPVINGLTDKYHPCQALADGLTIYENKKKLKGVKVTYIGDGNNVAQSLMQLADKTGLELTICTPKEYAPKKDIMKNVGDNVRLTDDISKAVKYADFIYTDTWASMGQEKEAEKRRKVFKDYQVNAKLLEKAPKDVKLMHCLPAHRGEEITDEVIESDSSIVFDQAENRLHAQKAVLVKLIK